jgi:hypothetical protein
MYDRKNQDARAELGLSKSEVQAHHLITVFDAHESHQYAPAELRLRTDMLA